MKEDAKAANKQYELFEETLKSHNKIIATVFDELDRKNEMIYDLKMELESIYAKHSMHIMDHKVQDIVDKKLDSWLNA